MAYDGLVALNPVQGEIRWRFSLPERPVVMNQVQDQLLVATPISLHLVEPVCGRHAVPRTPWPVPDRGL